MAFVRAELKRYSHAFFNTLSIPVVAAGVVCFTRIVHSVRSAPLFLASMIASALLVVDAVHRLHRGSCRGLEPVAANPAFVPGLALGLFCACCCGHVLEARRCSLSLPCDALVALTGEVAEDVLVDRSGRYSVLVVPDTLYDSGGTATRSSSDRRARVEIVAPLGASLFRGAYVEFSGIEADRNPGRFSTLTEPGRRDFSHRVWKVRAELFESIDRMRCHLEPSSSALFCALFLGFRSEELDDLNYLIRRAGCVHLLALSGMHVAVLIGFVLAILRPIVGKRCAGLVAVPLVTFYVFLIGAPPALLRAAFMFSIPAVVRGFGRSVRTLDAIGFAVVAGALIRPEDLGSLSFVLTYTAVVSIVIGGKSFSRILRRYLPRYVADALGVSLAAYSATAWVVIGSFGQSAPFGMVATLLLGPLVCGFLIAGVLILAWEVVIPAGMVPIWPMYAMLERLAESIEAVSAWFAVFPVIRVHPAVSVLISLALWCVALKRFGDTDELQLDS